ncbi:uncharacterized protein LOC144444612 [Glandiceps talaboti]
MAEGSTKKHLMYIYSKIESFNSAAATVRRSITDMINGDGDLKDNVEVLDYDGVNQRPLDSAYTVTAVVVIDSRQTRTLITPERRDPNVDHWDDLNMLYREKTKPKGFTAKDMTFDVVPLLKLHTYWDKDNDASALFRKVIEQTEGKLCDTESLDVDMLIYLYRLHIFRTDVAVMDLNDE